MKPENLPKPDDWVYMTIAVKVDKLKAWIHLRPCSPAEEPGRSLNEVIEPFYMV